MRPTISNVATIILTLCAVIVTGLVVRREFFAQPPVAEPEIREVENWEELAAAGQVIGPRDAAVKIVEFSDFQCPFCGRVQSALQEIRDRYPGQVAIVYRHFPLERIHPHAFNAALAAECAGAQGRFEAYHDALYENQDSIGVKRWEDFAELAGVSNLAAFRTCVEEERFRDRVEQDMEVGDSIDVRATPTFIVNGQMFSGALSMDEWEERVQAALNDD